MPESNLTCESINVSAQVVVGPDAQLVLADDGSIKTPHSELRADGGADFIGGVGFNADGELRLKDNLEIVTNDGRRWKLNVTEILTALLFLLSLPAFGAANIDSLGVNRATLRFSPSNALGSNFLDSGQIALTKANGVIKPHIVSGAPITNLVVRGVNTNGLLYTGVDGNVRTAALSGLTLSGGTLTASGGGSTNMAVASFGDIDVTNNLRTAMATITAYAYFVAGTIIYMRGDDALILMGTVDDVAIRHGGGGLGNLHIKTNLFITGSASITNNVWVGGDVSALTFTDRSKSPDTLPNAYAIVASIATVDGHVDHNKLSPLAWGIKELRTPTGRMLTNIVVGATNGIEKVPTTTNVVAETIATVVPDNTKRDLGMVISAQALVINDLIARLEKLEKK